MSTPTSLFDAFGSAVEVGDTVVFSDTVRKRILIKAVVKRVMPKTVCVEYLTQGYNPQNPTLTSAYLPSNRFMKVPNESNT